MKDGIKLNRLVVGGLVVLFMVAFAGQDAMARAGRGLRGPVSPELRVARLNLVLDLSEDQEKEIYALMVEEDKEIRSVHEKYKDSGRADRERARDEIRAIHDRYADEIEKCLTAEQAEKYREYRKQMAERRDGRHANRDGRGNGTGQGNGQGKGQGDGGGRGAPDR